ncbi:unnamed protein product [Closterium sp. Naga37s-1]|nr:unnamed protein product [Closterium sp. Naga37s-1]
MRRCLPSCHESHSLSYQARNLRNITPPSPLSLSHLSPVLHTLPALLSLFSHLAFLPSFPSLLDSPRCLTPSLATLAISLSPLSPVCEDRMPADRMVLRKLAQAMREWPRLRVSEVEGGRRGSIGHSIFPPTRLPYSAPSPLYPTFPSTPFPHPSLPTPLPHPSQAAPLPHPSQAAPLPHPSQAAPLPHPSQAAPLPHPSQAAPLPHPSFPTPLAPFSPYPSPPPFSPDSPCPCQEAGSGRRA